MLGTGVWRARFPDKFPGRNFWANFPDEISGQIFPEEISGQISRMKFPGKFSRKKFPGKFPGENSGQISPNEIPGKFPGGNFEQIWRSKLSSFRSLAVLSFKPRRAGLFSARPFCGWTGRYRSSGLGTLAGNPPLLCLGLGPSSPSLPPPFRLGWHCAF